MRKSTMRKQVIARRDALSQANIETKSLHIADRLFATKAYREAQRLFVFLSFGSEVRTRPIVERALADGKTVLVPRVKANEKRLELFVFEDYDHLEPSSYGILEPTDTHKAAALDDADFILVPGVAFDTGGARLGYGGGFYDRILSTSQAQRIALAFEVQIVPSVPATERDVAVPMILTEDRVIRP